MEKERSFRRLLELAQYSVGAREPRCHREGRAGPVQSRKVELLAGAKSTWARRSSQGSPAAGEWKGRRPVEHKLQKSNKRQRSNKQKANGREAWKQEAEIHPGD